ncbi:MULTISPECIES: hypothetical protein [Amycolatopsis]|uniref:Uncharacterized protein n=1 Tax=Amycolatopsis albidoflavus TaxID=102226 RepID=A0ABW5HPK5_9PSEU
MAYEIHLYCRTGGVGAVAGFDALTAGAAVSVEDRHSGEGWVSAEVGGGCQLEFSAGTPVVAAMIAELALSDESGRVVAADAIATLTLSGEVEWSVVSAVWRAAKSLWDVVPHDDGSGFAVDLDAL